MSPLTIYKASAGSGKTYTLTLEYIRLLLTSERKHRGILAVTFTNKAAGEMKARILSTLYRLSQNAVGPELPEMNDLLKNTNLSRPVIAAKSGAELIAILNDYSWFSVGTIDKFFQSVIRAFTREFGMQPGFNLELDRERVLNEAVNRLYLKLSGDRDLQEWLIRFAEENMENAGSWNFSRQILELGNELFREEFQQILLNQEKYLFSREEVNTFFMLLREKDRETTEKISKLAREALSLLEKNHLTTASFNGAERSSPARIFDKTAKGELYKFTSSNVSAITNTDKWLTKKTGPEVEQLVISSLQPALAAIYRLMKYKNTLTAISGNLYTLGIIGDLADGIREYTEERNLFLLSDSARFLKGLIGSNPSPFIYEKAGNAYDQIMLDEFQDTSVFQWDNFLPLISNSLAAGFDTLLVGDVKQSIYRFRNSDWRILAGQVEKDLERFVPKTLPLDVNFRSREHVINFNNSLFTLIPDRIGGDMDSLLNTGPESEDFTAYWKKMLANAYGDVNQKIPVNRQGSGGFVEMGILKASGKEFREKALTLVPDWIKALEDKGYKPGEICILVSTKYEGADLVRYLMDYDSRHNRERAYRFDLISNESLFLEHNPVIRLLSALMNYLRGVRSEQVLLQIRYGWYRLNGGENTGLHNAFSRESVLQDLLPPDFFTSEEEIIRLPVYELAEKLIAVFRLDRNSDDLPYLLAFLDLILEIQRNDPMSLHEFMEYWNESGKKKSLLVSENQDAIRIMTIHKSKGLQFKAVLLPFCSWDMQDTGHKAGILWCETAGTEFDALPLVPIKRNDNLKDSMFAMDLAEERIRNFIDKLNLLYVAFTRAEEVLMAALPEKGKTESGFSNAGSLVRDSLEMLGEETTSSWTELEDIRFYRKGEIPLADRVVVGNTEWPLGTHLPVVKHERLRLKLRSRDVLLSPAEGLRSLVDYGTLMHEIFSRIIVPDDIDRALKVSYLEGLLTEDELNSLGSILRQKLEDSRISDWFSERWVCRNEREIILPGGKIFRPDRVLSDKEHVVVIDYKFGLHESDSYLAQVRKYAALLAEMDSRIVKGYVWYVSLDRIYEAS